MKSSKDNKVGIGIIGTGVGIRTHLPAFRDLQSATIVAISGSSLDRASEFAGRNKISKAVDYTTLCRLPDVDLVCVTSPNTFHYAHVKAALEGGKHVLCEKPLALSEKENEDLIRLTEKFPNQISLVNHQLRFNPFLMTVKKILDEGQIGRPYFCRIHQQSTGFSNRNAEWCWSFDAQAGGGVRLAMGSHLVDLVHYWFSASVASVSACLDPVVTQRRLPDGQITNVDASSFFSSSLELENGLNVHMSATAAALSASGFEFSIFGDEGELHFDLEKKLTGAFQEDNTLAKIPSTFDVSAPEMKNQVSIFSGSFPYFASALTSAILTGDDSKLNAAATFADALKTQKVLDEIRISADRGTSRQMSHLQRKGSFF